MKYLILLSALVLSAAAQADIQFQCDEITTGTDATCPYTITDAHTFTPT